jgi:hypothetical protein
MPNFVKSTIHLLIVLSFTFSITAYSAPINSGVGTNFLCRAGIITAYKYQNKIVPEFSINIPCYWSPTWTDEAPTSISGKPDFKLTIKNYQSVEKLTLYFTATKFNCPVFSCFNPVPTGSTAISNYIYRIPASNAYDNNYTHYYVGYLKAGNGVDYVPYPPRIGDTTYQGDLTTRNVYAIGFSNNTANDVSQIDTIMKSLVLRSSSRI